MKKLFVNVFRVSTVVVLLMLIGAWANATWVAEAYASESVMEDVLMNESTAEYSAICTLIGTEPELCGVEVDEYLDCAEAWPGHMIIKAEKTRNYHWIEKDHYWSGPLSTTTEYGIESDHDVIVCTDTHGNEFKVHLES